MPSIRPALFVPILLAVIGGVLSNSAHAAGAVDQGLEISPPLVERSVKPGEIFELDVKVRNLVQTPIIAQPSVEDFAAKGEDGTPQILLGEPAATQYSFKKWTAAIKPFRLESQEQKTAAITINVPADAEPGGHYGVIRFTPVSPDGSTKNLSLSASIGTLVLVRVEGALTEKIEIREVTVSGLTPFHPPLQGQSLSVTELVGNTGTVHVKPHGSVKVMNMFGRTTTELAVNEPLANVLPQSARRFNQTWSPAWYSFGQYTLHAQLQYGNGMVLARDTTVWIIPYTLIGLVILLLFLLIIFASSSLKRHDARVLRRNRR